MYTCICNLFTYFGSEGDYIVKNKYMRFILVSSDLPGQLTINNHFFVVGLKKDYSVLPQAPVLLPSQCLLQADELFVRQLQRFI